MFPSIKIDRPECEDHVKSYLTSKYNYRFHTYNSFNQFGPYSKIKSGEAFQIKCSYCSGWRDMSELEIYGKELVYTDEEAQEIKKYLYHGKDYPNHIARILYKHYRRKLNPIMHVRSYKRYLKRQTFWYKLLNPIRKLMK